jgi:DedD protein
MIGADIEVSNSHEPSYYEIALTNRQVVVAFVILLVCLLCAFFSGVWIGRESTMRAQEQLAQNGGRAPAQEKKEGQALEEFDFFDDSKRPAASKSAAPAAPETPETTAPEPTRPEPEETFAAEPDRARETTLAEDLGGGEDTEALREPAPQPARPVVLPTPEERRRALEAQSQATAPVKPDSKKPAIPQPEERRAERKDKETVKPKPLPEAASAKAGSVVIQVFSSAEKDQADRIRERLVSGGQKAYLSPVQVGNRTMYRVRIGPFETRDKANKVADQVRKGYKLDTWVTE